jgi:hypothetical protein
MGTAKCRIQAVTRTVAFAAILPVAGCGSTAVDSLTAPSPVPAQAAQYPSVIGEWGGNSGLTLVYRNPDVAGSSHCDVSLSVQAQAEGTFSGSMGLNGSSMSSDKQCPGSFGFTAEMTPDGTITRFHPDRRLGSHECTAVSDPAFTSGTASSSGFRIAMTDHALCRWPPEDPRNPPVRQTDRTFTLSIDLRRRAP